MLLEEETFLAGLGVTGQSAVTESSAVRFLDHVNYPARNPHGEPRYSKPEQNNGARFERIV